MSGYWYTGGRFRMPGWNDTRAMPEGSVKLVAYPAADEEPLSLEQARDHLRLTAAGSPPSHPDDDWLTSFAIGAAREACEQETGRSLAPQLFELAVPRFPGHSAPRRYGDFAYGLRLPMAAPLISIESVTYRIEETVTAAALDDGLIVGSEPVLPVDGTLVRVSGLTIVDSDAVPLSLVENTDYTVEYATGIVTLLTAPGVQPYLASYTYTADRTVASTDYVVDSRALPAVLYPAPGSSWPATQPVPNAVIVRYYAGYDAPGASPIVNPLPFRAAAAIRLMLGHLYENREQTTPLKLDELPRGVSSLLSGLRIDLGMA